MNQDSSDHIIRFITAFTMGNIMSPKNYHLIFEWADGGRLNDLFLKEKKPILNGELVKRVAKQLEGLAIALKAIHDANIRHGDLKPGNILRFHPTKKDVIGTLKIGDWGLTKYHSESSTVLRKEKGLHTTIKYGTPFYEPPEVDIGDITFLYDVWSMGCIILKIIIWLLYGYGGIIEFHNDVKGSSKNGVPLYEREDSMGTEIGPSFKAKLRPIVLKWMDHINEQIVPDTALRALLTLVRNRLLVVDLPERMANATSETDDLGTSVAKTSPSQPAETRAEKIARVPERATSRELAQNIKEKILDDGKRPGDYWFREGPGRLIPSFSPR
ncbi:kinase-like domain-containing protein [Bombardia bombarda]|uniref:Kinase-like domain-containing protein n=1 Tax=Bombardia bombarda TaxID=252184 RepID=A0AA40CAI5_9PEZI|nr:kinase-like domain-containing protein [Bombardia bombarda]